MIRQSLSFLILVSPAFPLGASRAAEPQQTTTEAFDIDPRWDGFRNRLEQERPQQTVQDFGYHSTNRAGGKATGEIGGVVQRSSDAAFYAMPIRPKSLDEESHASGMLAVPAASGGSGGMIGWFAAPPLSWRTPNSLAFRIDGNGGKFWMFYEYGTSRWRTGGGGAFEGERYQTTADSRLPRRWQAASVVARLRPGRGRRPRRNHLSHRRARISPGSRGRTSCRRHQVRSLRHLERASARGSTRALPRRPGGRRSAVRIRRGSEVGFPAQQDAIHRAIRAPVPTTSASSARTTPEAVLARSAASCSATSGPATMRRRRGS